MRDPQGPAIVISDAISRDQPRDGLFWRVGDKEFEGGVNYNAACATIAGLYEQDALGDRDEAVVAAFLSLAVAVDLAPTKADLWREYRAFAGMILASVGEEANDDDRQFLATIQVRRSTSVRDPEDT